jgi:GT2 family glycosyltransferase
MHTSIIIPVWNGAHVIADCLHELYQQSGDALNEVICVENASSDESAALIAARFPQVRLLRQPVNLGFAGGVNVGLAAASGELMILLNQDCLVQPGWLTAIIQAMIDQPDFGIAGCTILNADGSLNHAGAQVTLPSAYGAHLTTITGDQPYAVETVTGALFAIRRQVWERLGPLDEDFYPAYYEETDYCYRARRQGFVIGYVPAARARHLFTTRTWQSDPQKHWANQHQMRYRFVVKHFADPKLRDFVNAEVTASAQEPYFDQCVGRALAARHTLHHLERISARRQLELGAGLSQVELRQWQAGFTQVLRNAIIRALALSRGEPDDAALEQRLRQLEAGLHERLQGQMLTLQTQLAEYEQTIAQPAQQGAEIQQRLQTMRQQEYGLLERIYFRAPQLAGQPEVLLRRLWRLLVLRPLSFLSGRDYLLLAQLNTVHVARLDQLEQAQMEVWRHTQTEVHYAYTKIEQALRELEQLQREMHGVQQEMEAIQREQLARLQRRVQTLQLLSEYEYR